MFNEKIEIIMNREIKGIIFISQLHCTLKNVISVTEID